MKFKKDFLSNRCYAVTFFNNGNLKSVGRIYQQTFIDTYSKVVHCNLYTTKTPITCADLLNDRVLPFYQSQGLPCFEF